MILREAIQQVKGLRYMVEQLELCSAVGRRCLLDSLWLTSKALLEEEFERIWSVKLLMDQVEGERLLSTIENKLMQVRDIRGTIKRIGTFGVLDDLELFELKYFALLSEEIRQLVNAWPWIQLPDLEPVVALLSPDGQRVPHFYIYDAYSEELAAVRLRLKEETQRGATDEEIERWYARSVELEDRVREELSFRMQEFHLALSDALENIGRLDLVLAKAKQARKWSLTSPVVKEEGEWLAEAFFHPQIQAVLEQEGRVFQAVDLRLGEEATLIIGANMAGKTVLLKSVQLLQYLTQFGFYVPARQAVVPLVEQVLTSIGDEQDELNGLSSFAAEMLRINEMIERIGKSKVLVLIDELARTTNPVEGKAIVNGVVEFLSDHRVRAMVTTHYSGITARCRKLRVKGFVENRMEKEMTLKNINEFMDYSLEEDHQDEVPREAFRMAWMLGIEPLLLERIESYLQEDAS